MKFRLALLWLGLWVVDGPAHVAAREPERVRISGISYVRLTDWARANDFDWHWLKRDETLQLHHATHSTHAQ